MGLEAINLTKRFFDAKRGEFNAVQSVSFACHKGEIFGLLGPNGAGKTTTLRMITTILKPTSGTAKINDFDVTTNPRQVRKQLGFVSADTGLYERLTPREILTYFGKLSKYPKEKLTERIAEVTSMLQMESFLDSRCEKLSTGMKQKVSIARAIVHDPPVIIMDEPTTGLDVLTSQVLHRFILQCKEMNKCVVFSSHIMSEAEKLCDRMAIIHKGQVLASGTLEELRAESGMHYLEDIFLNVVKEDDIVEA
ncbi:ATP-binding cassette domain-containing protein [Candidatus Obscuribacterales bacterium]|nr:ATP-binding cassette domain-containing protein [Candidatus Obscuribacterales bacterium]MBX3135147.1 ATP-binding cassette domain-containing protein [Candidatus Obscuribacterales bacterium]MBX3150269.1 ATP-binding cassette domain-containing protein [Candidatus Obscuribacterales bacterium]